MSCSVKWSKHELSENANPTTGQKLLNCFTSSSEPSNGIHPFSVLILKQKSHISNKLLGEEMQGCN